ncbi:MAG: hypothetical protein M0R66_04205 [Candidatus Omnitrophica bacterium]|nr:hypothetical protein [Candidatus Omnitrophota bacterium]
MGKKIFLLLAIYFHSSAPFLKNKQRKTVFCVSIDKTTDKPVLFHFFYVLSLRVTEKQGRGG